MFVYALTQPIDCFDGLIPLPRWITEDPDNNTAWALRATLALADARAQAGWTGGMRHLPSIGAIPAPGTADLFMVIKQDTRGTCFVISDTPMDWLLQHCHSHARPPDYDIGAWEHTTHSSLRNSRTQTGSGTVSGNSDEPPFLTNTRRTSPGRSRSHISAGQRHGSLVQISRRSRAACRPGGGGGRLVPVDDGDRQAAARAGRHGDEAGEVVPVRPGPGDQQFRRRHGGQRAGGVGAQRPVYAAHRASPSSRIAARSCPATHASST